MKSNERLIEALNRAIKNKPDVEIGKFIRYITSVSDLAYMTDEDIARQIEDYNELAEDDIKFWNYEFKPVEINYLDEALFSFGDSPSEKFYDFTKENEQIAYERYKEKTEGRKYFELTERLDCSDFLKRFYTFYVDPDDYKGITVINHRDDFLENFPDAYRHMNAYVVGRKGNRYVALHEYTVKNPCFGELFDSVAFGFRDGFDEIFAIAIDWMESPRFTDYTNHIMYGVCTRPALNEVEIYNTNQTIEIFHEWMQKSNKIIDGWDGVIYDDGTVDFM